MKKKALELKPGDLVRAHVMCFRAWSAPAYSYWVVVTPGDVDPAESDVPPGLDLDTYAPKQCFLILESWDQCEREYLGVLRVRDRGEFATSLGRLRLLKTEEVEVVA